jgi:hypothetical protein
MECELFPTHYVLGEKTSEKNINNNPLYLNERALKDIRFSYTQPTISQSL